MNTPPVKSSLASSQSLKERILYEDNHIIAINKLPGEIVQKDKTGDTSLPDLVKEMIKARDSKPGNVFLGVPHRLDRPTSGVVVFAKTSKALERLTLMFRTRETHKTYLVATKNRLPKETGVLETYIWKNEKENKSYCLSPKLFPPPKEKSEDNPYSAKDDLASSPSKEKLPHSAKYASLSYSLLSSSQSYYFYSVVLHTGRHHQIRCQFATEGCPVAGDIKYGAKRTLNSGAIALHSYILRFNHPVSHNPVEIVAPLDTLNLPWKFLPLPAQE